MTTQNDKPQTTTQEKTEQSAEKILCPHCLRTATNGIKCQGICIADSDY
ncbi:hypothetical protein ACQ4M3_01850 [Leptolyngbya sp. AN03gr2]